MIAYGVSKAAAHQVLSSIAHSQLAEGSTAICIAPVTLGLLLISNEFSCQVFPVNSFLFRHGDESTRYAEC